MVTSTDSVGSIGVPGGIGPGDVVTGQISYDPDASGPDIFPSDPNDGFYEIITGASTSEIEINGLKFGLDLNIGPMSIEIVKVTENLFRVAGQGSADLHPE